MTRRISAQQQQQQEEEEEEEEEEEQQKQRLEAGPRARAERDSKFGSQQRARADPPGHVVLVGEFVLSSKNAI